MLFGGGGGTSARRLLPGAARTTEIKKTARGGSTTGGHGSSGPKGGSIRKRRRSPEEDKEEEEEEKGEEEQLQHQEEEEAAAAAAAARVKKRLRMTRIACSSEVMHLDKIRRARAEVAELRRALQLVASHHLGAVNNHGMTAETRAKISHLHDNLHQQWHGQRQQQRQQPTVGALIDRSQSKRLEETWDAFLRRNEKRWRDQIERESRKEVEGKARQRTADARITRLEDVVASMSRTQQQQHEQQHEQQQQQQEMLQQLLRHVTPMIPAAAAAAVTTTTSVRQPVGADAIRRGGEGRGGEVGGGGDTRPGVVLSATTVPPLHDPPQSGMGPSFAQQRRVTTHDYDSLRWTQPHQSQPKPNDPPRGSSSRTTTTNDPIIAGHHQSSSVSQDNCQGPPANVATTLVTSPPPPSASAGATVPPLPPTFIREIAVDPRQRGGVAPGMMGVPPTRVRPWAWPWPPGLGLGLGQRPPITPPNMSTTSGGPAREQ